MDIPRTPGIFRLVRFESGRIRKMGDKWLVCVIDLATKYEKVAHNQAIEAAGQKYVDGIIYRICERLQVGIQGRIQKNWKPRERGEAC
jgi:hypothetical protein